MQRSKKIVLAAAVAAVAQFSIHHGARAADVRWDGGGADNNLTTGANWVGDVAPGSADFARFDAVGNSKLNPTTAGGAVQYNSIFFGNFGTAEETDAYVIGGANAITLGSTTAGNYLNNDSEVLQTINAPINMIGGTVNATFSSLHFGGLFNVGNGGNAAGNSVTINTNGNSVTLAGGITGAADGTNDNARILKNGAGTLFVTADSSAWLGRVQINGGALQISHGNALGSGGGNIITSGNQNTGTLELSGGITVSKNVQTHGREGTAINVVSIRNVSGNNVLNNVITQTGGATYNYESLAGNVRINAWNTTASSGARTLRLLGAGNGEIDNWTPNANNAISVVKEGAGTWTLRPGMIHATASLGALTVNGGNLVLDGGLGARVVGNSALNPAIVPNVTVNNGGTLTVISPDGTTGEVGNYVSPTTITVASGGTFNASTFSNYSLQIGQTLIAGGTIQAGRLSVFGDNAIRIGNSAAPAAGTMTVVGDLSLSNLDSSPSGGLYYDLSNVTTVGGGVNDLVSVQGSLLVDGSSGPINVRLNSLTGALATGTYRLIDFTSGATPSASDFTLTGFDPSATRQSVSVATAPNQVNLVVSGNVANLVWTGANGDVWEASASGPLNWLNGATPDRFLQGDNVSFTESGSNPTINVVGTLTPSSITVNASKDYAFVGNGALAGGAGLTKSGTGKLTIANVGPNTLTGPVIINAGTLQIGNGGADGSIGSGAITNNATLIWDRSAAQTMANVIDGSGALIKRGSGTLALNGANTYTGATTIEAGTVNPGNATAFGDAATGTTVLAGANVYSTSAKTIAEPFTLSGDGPVAGEGALRTGGSALTTFSGPITLAGNAGFKMDGNAQMTLSNTVTGTDTTLTLRGDGGSVGRLNGTVSLGSGALLREGSGTWILTGTSHAWTGGTTITGGTLQLGEGAVAGDLPAGTLSVTAGTLAFGSTETINFSRTVTGAGTILQAAGGGSTTLSGDLTGFTGTITAGSSTSTAGVTSTLIVATPTGATTLRVADVNASGGTQQGFGHGILRVTNSNALASGGTIDIQAAQAAGTGRLELGNNVNLNAGTINVAQRSNATPAILSADGNNTLTGNIVISTGGNFARVESAAGATLTLNGTVTHAAGSARNFVLQGAGTGVVNAAIINRVDNTVEPPINVPLNVHKDGTGTWTLAGANTYTGTTTVNEGTLRLASNLTTSSAVTVNAGTLHVAPGGGSSRVVRTPSLTVAAGAKVDVGDNKLIVASPGAIGSWNGSAYTGVTGLVQSGRNEGTWDGSGIVTSQPEALTDYTTVGVATAADVLGIGPGDTEVWAGQTVTGSDTLVMYTYGGDANLDGVLNIDDYGQIDFNVGLSGVVFGYFNGDFNYDGLINIDDYGIIDFNIGIQGPPFPTAGGAGGGAVEATALSGVAAVPEPASVALLALGAASLLGRRRRHR